MTTQLYHLIPDELAGSWQENDRRGYISVDLYRFRPVFDEAPGILKALSKAIDFAEQGWGIIANSSGGDWEKESKEWQEAAAKYRDQFHDEIRFLAGVPNPEPSVKAQDEEVFEIDEHGKVHPYNPFPAQAGQLWRVVDSYQPNCFDIDIGEHTLRMVTDDYQMACDLCDAHNSARPVPAQACEGLRSALVAARCRCEELKNTMERRDSCTYQDLRNTITDIDAALAQSCPCQQSGEQPKNLSGGQGSTEPADNGGAVKRQQPDHSEGGSSPAQNISTEGGEALCAAHAGAQSQDVTTTTAKPSRQQSSAAPESNPPAAASEAQIRPCPFEENEFECVSAKDYAKLKRELAALRRELAEAETTTTERQQQFEAMTRQRDQWKECAEKAEAKP